MSMKMDIPALGAKAVSAMMPALVAAPAFADVNAVSTMPLSLEVTFTAYLAVLLGTFVPVTFLIVLYSQVTNYSIYGNPPRASAASTVVTVASIVLAGRALPATLFSLPHPALFAFDPSLLSRFSMLSWSLYCAGFPHPLYRTLLHLLTAPPFPLFPTVSPRRARLVSARASSKWTELVKY